MQKIDFNLSTFLMRLISSVDQVEKMAAAVGWCIKTEGLQVPSFIFYATYEEAHAECLYLNGIFTFRRSHVTIKGHDFPEWTDYSHLTTVTLRNDTNK